jgi:hypothetical protein
MENASASGASIGFKSRAHREPAHSLNLLDHLAGAAHGRRVLA